MSNLYKWGIALTAFVLVGVAGYTFFQPKNESCHAEIIIPKENTPSQYRVLNEDFDIPDKILTTNLEEKVSLKQLIDQDKPVFIQFIFTSCPTICPVLSSHFAGLQAAATTAETPIQMISISIDPEYDTPKRLQAYGEKFDAQSAWTFLTGNKTDIIQIQKAFDNYEGNKMYHKPVTYLKHPDNTSWKIMDGFISGAELWQEYQQLLAAK